MPYYVANPGGKIVELDDEDQFNKWSHTAGFTVPSQDQIDRYRADRLALIEAMKNPPVEETDEGIYLATVTQGGKDGYGCASAGLIKELRALGVKVGLHDYGQKIALLFHNPYSVLRLEAPCRIVYTMFESDKIPDDWPDYLHAADLVLVPSKWCQAVFAESGVNTRVVPLGYDDTAFTFIDRPIKRDNRGTFTFLHYNAYNIRKGFVEVFKAFVKEFAPDEPVKMIFKTTLDNPPIPIEPEQYPNIEVISGKVENDKMREIMTRADCFVFPSRGEGFGMTPLEAMATGLPAIIPNAHGITEYFNPELMYEVKVAEECPALYSSYKGQNVGHMVITDVDDLRRQMRYVYEHQEEAYQKGALASQYVKRWTYAETARQLKDIFDEITKNPLPERQIKNVLPLELM